MAKKDRASRKGNKGITVDLSGVETGSKKAIPEGEYPVSVNAATLETSDRSGGQYIKLEFEVTDGKNKGSKLFHNCSLQPQALFNLKSVLAALGFEIPKKAFDLDLKELIGLECVVEVSHELYEGKKKARITDFINPEDAEGSDEEDEDEDEKDYSEMSLEELKEECDEQEIDYKKAIKGKKDKDAKKILIELLEEADEDEDGEDESDEDSEEEDDEDEQDYEDMDIDELKAECKERGIKFGKKAKKAELIELLEEDDEE